MTPTLSLTLRLPTSIPEALLTSAIGSYLQRGKWVRDILFSDGTEALYNLTLDRLSLTDLAQLSEVLRRLSHTIPSLSYSGYNEKELTQRALSSTTPKSDTTFGKETVKGGETSTRSRKSTGSRKKTASSSSSSRTAFALAKYRKGG